MEGGSIINVGSVAGLLGFPGLAAYSASKAAVVSLTQTAAAELASKRIRVNCVCPGSIDTPMMRQQENADTEIAVVEAASAAGRIGRPEEVAALIHFLASDDRYINGQAITIDGGLLGIYSNSFIDTIRHDGLSANGGRVENLARARELLRVPATQSEPADASAGESAMLSLPCPCCGGRMIIIETFERGATPRTRPTSPIRIDTS